MPVSRHPLGHVGNSTERLRVMANHVFLGATILQDIEKWILNLQEKKCSQCQTVFGKVDKKPFIANPSIIDTGIEK